MSYNDEYTAQFKPRTPHPAFRTKRRGFMKTQPRPETKLMIRFLAARLLQDEDYRRALKLSLYRTVHPDQDMSTVSNDQDILFDAFRRILSSACVAAMHDALIESAERLDMFENEASSEALALVRAYKKGL